MPGRLVVPVTGMLGTPATAAALPPAVLERDAAATADPMPTAFEDNAVPTVTGSFSIQRFARTTDGGVAAVGILTLSFLDPDSNAARTIITPGAMPLATASDIATPDGQPQVSPPAIAQSCETLSLVLAPVRVELPGRPVELDALNVDVVRGADERLATLLCEAVGQMNQATPPPALVKMLNTLLEAIG